MTRAMPVGGRSARSVSAVALPDELIERVQRRLAVERSIPDPPALARAARAEVGGVVDDAQMLALIRRLEQELVGCGPLTGLLADPDTTDVVVNGAADVRVDRGNGWEQAGVTFADDAAVQRLARRLAAQAGARLDDAHPFVDGHLADGTRLHALLPPLSPAGTCLSLRVLRPARYDLAALADAGLFPGCTAAVVRAVIEARLAFMVSGGTGSGKTTLLEALLGAVAPGERIVTVEDAQELHPDHPHVVRLVARPANVEGVGAVGLRELVRQALRMRPDRLVVGEVRGAEVVDLLGALTTGHDGGAGTVHANGAADVPGRLAALAALGSVEPAALQAQLASALQVVLHLRRDGGRRRLAEIAVMVPGGGVDGGARVGTGADARAGAGARTSVGARTGMGAGLGVRALPAFVDGQVHAAGAAVLAEMLASRGVGSPW